MLEQYVVTGPHLDGYPGEECVGASKGLSTHCIGLQWIWHGICKGFFRFGEEREECIKRKIWEDCDREKHARALGIPLWSSTFRESHGKYISSAESGLCR